MAPPIETGPSTSYSDPIYDRLDSVAQRVARRWPLLLGVVVAAVVVAVVIRTVRSHDPAAASAVAYVNATQNAENDAERKKALDALADDTGIRPYYRARALCDLAQMALAKHQLDDAKKLAERAGTAAAQVSGEDDAAKARLGLDVQLTQAGVAEEAKDLDAALRLYQKVAADAGQRYRMQEFAASLGAARVLRAQATADKDKPDQAKLDQAIEILGRLKDRTEAGARNLIDIAKQMYWSAVRQKAGAVDLPYEKPTPPGAPTVPIPQPGMPAMPGMAPTIPGMPAPIVPQVPTPPIPQVPMPQVPGAGAPMPPAPGVPTPGAPSPEGH